jgi:hypothetical protein
MARHKLTLKDLTVTEKLATLRRLVTGAKHLPSVDALNGLATLEVWLEEAEALAAEAGQLEQLKRAKVAERNVKLKQLCALAPNVASGVWGQVRGEPTELLASGLDIAKPKNVRLGTLPAPQDVRAAPGAQEGSIVLRWKRVYGKRSYLIERTATPDVAGSWELVMMCTKAKCVVGGLESGKLMWFRVVALGAAGRSPCSGLASARAR